MDLATLLGIILCFFFVIFGIVFDQDNFTVHFNYIANFIDVPSLLITLGGSFSSVLIMFKLKEYVDGLKGITLALKEKKIDHAATIKQIIELSNLARKEGLLALEEAASNLDDDFLKKGVLLIVDGTEPDLVRGILETELTCVEARHKKVFSFWDQLASMGPAWGMIGTLIGLINMLKFLDDPSSIGPNMAVALITTLYGSMLANWIAIPVAMKLRANNGEEITLKEVMIEGLLSIQAGENPRVIEEKLKSFLSPEDRKQFGGDEDLKNEAGGEA